MEAGLNLYSIRNLIQTEKEFLETAYIPAEEVKEMLKNGEIRDAKTIIALQTYFLSEK